MANPDESASTSKSRDWVISAMILAGSTATTVTPGAASTHNTIVPHAKGVEQYTQCPHRTCVETSSGDRVVDFLSRPQTVTTPPDWHFQIAQRINELAEKRFGWKGPDSASMLNRVREHSLHFLSKLGLEGVDRRPSVGLDFEGTLSFSWADDELQADLTIFEDGTYSYYAKNGTMSASADEASLSDNFDGHFLSLLLS
ncbi:hypothetical protein PVW46_17330 [Mameliella sp. AT18]|uniref:hypothetical protein n=1 Tax=Mameliella sp. AT18 TaxID=3028385 RepID=UPI001112CEB9|nr:hypothetical protein [Mameliella sp. AT18]MDD9731669.1 hypothetical protein [Mameliella sp. AT18]